MHSMKILKTHQTCVSLLLDMKGQILWPSYRRIIILRQLISLIALLKYQYLSVLCSLTKLHSILIVITAITSAERLRPIHVLCIIDVNLWWKLYRSWSYSFQSGVIRYLLICSTGSWIVLCCVLLKINRLICNWRYWFVVINHWHLSVIVLWAGAYTLLRFDWEHWFYMLGLIYWLPNVSRSAIPMLQCIGTHMCDERVLLEVHFLFFELFLSRNIWWNSFINFIIPRCLLFCLIHTSILVLIICTSLCVIIWWSILILRYLYTLIITKILLHRRLAKSGMMLKVQLHCWQPLGNIALLQNRIWLLKLIKCNIVLFIPTIVAWINCGEITFNSRFNSLWFLLNLLLRPALAAW